MQIGREKVLASVLVEFYASQGWILFEEFQVPGTILDLGRPDGLIQQRLRPDIFGLKKGVMLAIEVENGPFLHHATSYVHIANYCYLCYPADSEQTLTRETVQEQIDFAMNQGIGVLRVSFNKNGAPLVTELFPAVRRELRPEVKKRLIHLAWKRYIKEQTQFTHVVTSIGPP